ncbi:hypothetical protein D3C83_17760 [compost metagenome]
MAFRGEVHDRPRPVLAQEPADQRAVVDVALDENMPRVVSQAGQVAGIAGVGQRVEIDDGGFLAGEPVDDEIGADEAGAAGDQDHVRAFLQSRCLVRIVEITG